ncbi:hypothetical protein [Sneathiella glossodoripedis]|uniref:hypothetical protein n=1 Tax=Sneathiella glossodoripedis TaxID=418853 RepID=UPI00047017F4|nr:hypothetical protein [Sneathiella glossodoripedis]
MQSVSEKIPKISVIALVISVLSNFALAEPKQITVTGDKAGALNCLEVTIYLMAESTNVQDFMARKANSSAIAYYLEIELDVASEDLVDLAENIMRKQQKNKKVGVTFDAAYNVEKPELCLGFIKRGQRAFENFKEKRDEK